MNIKILNEFRFRYCELATTFSMDGTSYVQIVDELDSVALDDKYSLTFWFRTTLPSGILAVGQGQTYFSLELKDGRLNLHSSILNE